MGAADMPQETELAALLNLFMYLDYEEEVSGKNFAEVLKKASARSEIKEKAGAQHALEILTRAIGPGGSHPELTNMQVTIPNHDAYRGINAAVFINGNDAYVVYRGTGDGKWIDNGEGMTAVMTPSQEQAIAFLDEMAEQFGWDEGTNLTVSGHSKGGNNSQAATLGAEHGYLVDQCISFDGQGMSAEGAAHYREELGPVYDVRTNRMYSVCGENDPVNELGESMFRKDHVYYIETNAGEGEVVPTHALEYLFQREDEKGNLYFADRMNGESGDGQGPIGRYARQLNEALMQMPEEIRNDCAMALMQLIEILNGQGMYGYNGHRATVEEFAGFLWHGMPAILQTLLLTEDGREALGALLSETDWESLMEDLYKALEEKIRESIEKDGAAATIGRIAALILALPLLAGIAFDIVRAGIVVLSVVEILDHLRVLTEEIREFLNRCWEAVKTFAEDVGNWVKEHVMGQVVVRDADFCTNVAALEDAASRMGTVGEKYLRAVGRMDVVRRSLPVQGLGGWALRAKIGGLENRVQGVAQKAGKMAGILESCSGKYQSCEGRVRDNVMALA